MMWTVDPLADFERYDSEQQEELEKLPRCCICHEHIQDESCYVISDEIYCEECHNDEFKKWTEDLME